MQNCAKPCTIKDKTCCVWVFGHADLQCQEFGTTCNYFKVDNNFVNKKHIPFCQRQVIKCVVSIYTQESFDNEKSIYTTHMLKDMISVEWSADI